MARTKVLIVLSVIFQLSCGLDMKGAMEGSCLNPAPEVAKNVNAEWMSTGAKEWFYPLFSKLDVYRAAEDVSGRSGESLTEEDVARSCMTIEWNGLEAAQVGFGGRRKVYEFGPRAEGGMNWWPKPVNGVKKGHSAVSYITKTDNKSYVVGVSCWPDNQKTFAVWSPYKTLNEETKQEVTEHLISLGFDPKYFYEGKYDNCFPPESISKVPKEL